MTGLLVLARRVPVGIPALSRAWTVAAGPVIGPGRLAGWLSGAEVERAAEEGHVREVLEDSACATRCIAGRERAGERIDDDTLEAS